MQMLYLSAKTMTGVIVMGDMHVLFPLFLKPGAIHSAGELYYESAHT
jgi:hypothetical protein